MGNYFHKSDKHENEYMNKLKNMMLMTKKSIQKAQLI